MISMSKYIVILMVLLTLSGCNDAKGNQILKDYSSNFNAENRDQLYVCYDYDGIFDEYTVKDLIKLSLEEDNIDPEDIKLDNYDIDEINNKVNQYKLNIIDDTGFIFNDNYLVTKDSINERDIRIILENDDMKISIYQGGYVKVFKDNQVTQYKSENDKFNDNISKFYKNINSMNEYTLDILKEINKNG